MNAVVIVAVVVQTLVLGLVLWRVARDASVAAPSGRRVGAIAALLLAQAAVTYAFTLGVLPSMWRDGSSQPPGLVWSTQAVRVALLVAAARLWYGMSRDMLAIGRRRVVLVLALMAIGFGGDATPLIGFGVMLWLASRATWSQELSGWRRLSALLVGPLLLLVVSFSPVAVVRDGRLTEQFTLFSDPWQASLMRGTLPARLQAELALARPLDRVAQALLDLFRAQLIVLSLRALTMPMRLHGMSLRRRFLVNYIFVRNIPSVLGLLTLLVAGYVAFGVFKATQARGELERTLARADATLAATLDDPRATRGGRDADARLEAARAWLLDDGRRAHLVLRALGPAAVDDSASEAPPATVIAHTAGVPPAMLALATPTPPPGARAEGLVEDGDGIYLMSSRRSAPPDTSRVLTLFVPLDSTFVDGLARTLGTRIIASVQRGVAVDVGPSRGMAFSPDTTGRRPIRIASEGRAAPSSRDFFLGRSYLPLGDWRSGWRSSTRGAVALELRTNGALLLNGLSDVPGWLYSNVVTVVLLLAMFTLLGITEGFAVRSGRGILKSLEDEVASLREAAGRIGSGDLGHRIPIRGRDELSALAGSFNDMAANLERQRVELVEKERLEEDLEVARSIQRRFLPQHPPCVPGLEVAGVSVPSREVGGDLFHYVELGDGRLGIALGDVSGKSVPAALIMSNVMSALRAEAQHEPAVEKSLERINRLIGEQIEPGRFVTLFYGVVDPVAGRLRYSSAGHNPVLLVSAAGETTWLTEGGVPLGVLPAATYPAATVPLAPGDVVVAYSDGVTEAEGPGAGDTIELFGEDRLVEVVVAQRHQPVDAIVAGVLDAVRRFAAGRAQADDITLVVVRRS